MSNALADHIRACLDRAAEAERLASCEVDPVAKTELLELASGWRQVALSYQYVERLEKFLQTFKAPKGPQVAPIRKSKTRSNRLA
jgi:hypothetical protein